MNRFNAAWIISIVILLGLGGYLQVYKSTPTPLRIDFKQLPLVIGEWRWVRTDPSPKDLFGIKGADIELMNVYKNGLGHQIKLYIAYFEFQKEQKKVIGYHSKWLHKRTNLVEISTNPHGIIRINKTVMQDPINDRMLLFWYDLNGRIAASRYKAQLFTIFDSLTMGRTNGAIIIIFEDAHGPEHAKENLNEGKEFVKELLPVLRKYLPS